MKTTRINSKKKLNQDLNKTVSKFCQYAILLSVSSIISSFVEARFGYSEATSMYSPIR